MRDHSALGPWIRRFLLEHLTGERNLSKNTQHSYRDTMALLAPFASAHSKTQIDRLRVGDLTGDIVRAFLKHLEVERSCSGRTRNQRLSAIHAFGKFVGERSPEHIAWCGGVGPCHLSEQGRCPFHTSTNRRSKRFSMPRIAEASRAVAITVFCYCLQLSRAHRQ